MKKIKSLLTMTLIATIFTGAIIESAEAKIVRGSGSKTIGSRQNQVDVEYDFKVYSIDLLGQPRVDEDGNLTNNMGIFTGAIEDFTGTIKDTFEVVDGDPIGTFPEFDEVALSKETLDLNVILKPGNSIEYILTGTPLTNKNIEELALIIDDNFKSVSDPVKAVNDIKEIIEKGLLGQIDAIRVKTKTESDISSDIGGGNLPVESIGGLERVVDIPDPENPTTVPESNTTNSLLAFGILGTGLLLKRTKNKLSH